MQHQELRGRIIDLSSSEGLMALQTRLTAAGIEVDLDCVPASRVPEAFREGMCKLLEYPIDSLSTEQIRAITAEVDTYVGLQPTVAKDWETIDLSPYDIQGIELKVLLSIRGQEVDIKVTNPNLLNEINFAGKKFCNGSVIVDRDKIEVFSDELAALLSKNSATSKFILGWCDEKGKPYVYKTRQEFELIAREAGYELIPHETRSLVIAACAAYRLVKGFVDYHGNQLDRKCDIGYERTVSHYEIVPHTLHEKELQFRTRLGYLSDLGCTPDAGCLLKVKGVDINPFIMLGPQTVYRRLFGMISVKLGQLESLLVTKSWGFSDSYGNKKFDTGDAIKEYNREGWRAHNIGVGVRPIQGK